MANGIKKTIGEDNPKTTQDLLWGATKRLASAS